MNRSDLLRAGFVEGSLAGADGRSKPWFQVLASAAFRSSVIEDVYHQTGDPEDRKGGYTITILRALK
jgi:hypothetical protein